MVIPSKIILISYLIDKNQLLCYTLFEVIFVIIYKITNQINGKVYIGQTINTLEHRKQQHLKCAKYGNSRHLYNAMRKYGVENFKFEQIDTANSLDDLNYLETYYIVKYDSVRSGYNMSYGGDNNIMFEEKSRQKHDDIMRSDAVRNKISKSMREYRKIHPFSDEHRRKLSEKAKGNHNFGSGDTRSIGCFCVDEFGNEQHFHSYRDGYNWWKTVENPFDTLAECVYQRKIKQSIKYGKYTYKHNTYEFPKWYKE